MGDWNVGFGPMVARVAGLAGRARVTRVAAIVTVAVTAVATAAQTQTLPLQATLNGTVNLGAFGSSVAVDGNTAAVAAFGQGRVHVFTRSGSTWTRVQLLQSPTTSVSFGTAVAVSGTTIAVGGSNAVQVFVRSGGTWVHQATVASTLAGVSSYGTRIALEGNTLVVGAWSSPIAGVSGAGRTFVYERSGTTWTEQELISGVSPEVQDYFGYGVGLSGNTICVGAPEVQGTPRKGSGFVFTRLVAGGAWSLQQRIVPVQAAIDDEVGRSCDVDGDTVVFGSSFGMAAFVYTRTPQGSTWTSQARLTGAGLSLQNAGTTFSQNVALAGDRLFASAEGAGTASGIPGAGQVHFYTRTGATWTEGTRYTVTSGGYQFGAAIAFDGTSLIIGGPCINVSGCAGLAAVLSSATGPSELPGPPTNFQVSVSGNHLSTSWGAPATGVAPTAYTLIARAAIGGAPLATLPLGLATAFEVDAPNGTFVLSVQAANGVRPRSGVRPAHGAHARCDRPSRCADGAGGIGSAPGRDGHLGGAHVGWRAVELRAAGWRGAGVHDAVGVSAVARQPQHSVVQRGAAWHLLLAAARPERRGNQRTERRGQLHDRPDSSSRCAHDEYAVGFWQHHLVVLVVWWRGHTDLLRTYGDADTVGTGARQHQSVRHERVDSRRSERHLLLAAHSRQRLRRQHRFQPGHAGRAVGN